MKTQCAHCNIETRHLTLVLSKYSYLNGKKVCKACVEHFVKPEIRNYKGYLHGMRKRINTIQATVQPQPKTHTDVHTGTTFIVVS